MPRSDPVVTDALLEIDWVIGRRYAVGHGHPEEGYVLIARQRHWHFVPGIVSTAIKVIVRIFRIDGFAFWQIYELAAQRGAIFDIVLRRFHPACMARHVNQGFFSWGARIPSLTCPHGLHQTAARLPEGLPPGAWFEAHQWRKAAHEVAVVRLCRSLRPPVELQVQPGLELRQGLPEDETSPCRHRPRIPVTNDKRFPFFGAVRVRIVRDSFVEVLPYGAEKARAARLMSMMKS